MTTYAQAIPRQFWQHSSGRTASLYGSVPWVSAADKAEWTVVTKGWTVKWPDGTIGTPKPFATKEDAEAFIAGTKFGGYSMMSH